MVLLLGVVLSLFVGSFGLNCTSTNCIACTQNTCNWCSSYSSSTGSFCTALTSASAAGCNGQGVDQMDEFITDTPDCYSGGCGGAEYCTDCMGRVGCGWCFAGGMQGCIAGSANSPPPGCTAWAYDTCVQPCPARMDCNSCFNNKLCVWCSTGAASTAGTCQDASGSTGSSSCYTSVSSCPAIAAPNHAGRVAVAVLIPVIATAFAMLM